MPEFPYRFEGVEADRLTGAEIKALRYGHRINGKARAHGNYELDVAEDGSWVWRFEGWQVSGKGHIEGDSNCRTSDDIALGRTHCYPIYRNPTGTRAEYNEYVYVDVADMYRFSVVD